MKEGSSLDGKMIDRDWAPRRKRKQKLSGFDASTRKQETSVLAESEKISLSLTKRLKEDLDTSPKLKGRDGYYFDCEKCDLGGNLLCCDSCPRTYHLDCLSPPLKHSPFGQWKCPKCCVKKEDKPLITRQTSSRRVRNKNKIQKAKGMHDISSLGKASNFKRSSVGINKSTSKGEDSFSSGVSAFKEKVSSCHTNKTSSMKSNPSGDSILMVGVPTTENSKTKKKAVSLSRRNTSKQKLIRSLVKPSKPNASDKLSKEEPDAYRNENHGNNLHLPVVLSSQISKKNRKLTYRIDKNKRPKSYNVKRAGCVSNDTSEDGLPYPESSGSPPKYNSLDNLSRLSNTKQETRLLRSPRKKQLETSHVLSSLSLDDGSGLIVENKMSCNGIFSGEVQQVDRILGCRVRRSDQTNEIATSQPESQEESNSGRLQNKLLSSDLFSQKIHDKLDDCYDNSRVIDMKDSEFTHAKSHQSVATSIAQIIVGNCSNESDAEVKDKSFASSEHMGKDKIIGPSVSHSFMAHCMSSRVSELPVDSITGVVIKERVAKNDLEGSSVVEYLLSENCDVHHTPVPDLTVTCKPQDIHLMNTLSKSDQSVENVILNQAVPNLNPKENDAVICEFLVKWVGKSNIHNSWVSEVQLKTIAKRKLENYKAKYGTAVINICKDQWCQPQRIISLQESHAGREALVKWSGLPYDDCTWEKLDSNICQNSYHLISEFKQFETQALDNDARNDIVKSEIQEVVSLLEQPKELKGGLLFPHQLEALNWLRRCWHKSKNVILADEMGLGKTVSACSFISSLFFEFKVKLPCLVLVPLSTMPNWLSEFELWAPHLNVVEYHGCAKARSIIRLHEWHASVSDGSHKRTKSYKFNVLLTTYEMILADSFHLRGVQWELLIVDEGHRLKNSGSKLFSLLNSFSFQHRVLLTGTPLQNNIGEMYNLLNFLQPASFPSLSAFEENFKDLTTTEKVEELKKLVAPHMLRRLKKDAMQNIPPKTERMVPVELTSVQAEYYRAMLTKNYQILRNIGKGVAQQSMLNIVMQLRKVCNHPYLIPGTEPESGSVEFLQEMRIKASAKLTLLHSMLKILHMDGHRVLIFSQMTKLLDILEDYLTVEFGHGTFERVDGSVSVTDRQAAITRFNKDKTCFVFLLSTRSCGLGINLATADTVVIYDSDFNPHADIQAMNRAHRIGQSNRLLVYRLVVRASVEERILQLARKKLMLDQLFVNKSGSQKEVEDILRWGTEELFGDCDGANDQYSKDSSISKVDSPACGEHKHRRRIGGLGDVYMDRCTDGGTKIVWDETAIFKLLDRSVLQTSESENADGDLDSDLLGSVKPLDWSDEQLNGELGGTEMITNLAGDGCEPSDTKEDNANTVSEENEWDRLLRERWEKYQLEEEATLGRGKRLRKAVSYRETFTSILSEALSESVNEEPERKYSLAGRALKEKYMKLRARQKERIARKHTVEVHSSAEGPELLIQSPVPDSKEAQCTDSNAHSEGSTELDLLATPYESKYFQSFDAKNSSYSTSKQGRTSKHDYKRYHASLLSYSVRPPDLSSDSIPPINHFQNSSTNCVPSSAFSPVLGLCALNVSRRNSTGRRNSTTQIFNSLLSQPASTQDHGRTSTVLDILSPPAVTGGPLLYNNVAGQEFTDLSPGEALHRRLKNIIPDSYFPFGPPQLPIPGKCPSDPSDIMDTSFSSFREKLGLPNLVSDEGSPLKIAIPSISSMKMQADFSSNVPLVPTFGQHLNGALKQKQMMPESPPMLNLGLLQTGASLPENDMKVLDRIMIKTQTDVHKFMKRLKVDAWSEDELDALWIGVRRHGKGNWYAILQDPKLKILKHRSVEELLSKWNVEQHKIMEGHVPASFLGLSDGMMTRALHGSRFTSPGTELPRFRSRFTDIQLGSGEFMPRFPFLEPSSHSGLVSESLPPLPTWLGDTLKSNCIGNFGVGPVDRFEKTNLPLDQASFSASCGVLGMNLSSSCSPQKTDDVSARNKRMKLPSMLEKSLSLLRETQNIHSYESGSGLLHDVKGKQISSKSLVEDDSFPGRSNEDKLPHWLREAFSAPRPPEPALPPSISAISRSVRLLYGEDKITIPPFLIPGPLPLLPKDPRNRLRKKRKMNMFRKGITENVSPTGDVDICASFSIPSLLFCSIPPPASQLMKRSVPAEPPPMTCTISLEPPPMTCTISLEPPSTSSFPGHPRKESGCILSSLNLNLNLPSPSCGDQGMSTPSPCPAVEKMVSPCTDLTESGETNQDHVSVVSG